MMREGQASVIRREDYTAPAYWIDTVDLAFDLDPAKTRVLNRMRMRRNPDVAPQALRLDGEELNLARVLVNGSGTRSRWTATSWCWRTCPKAPSLSSWRSSPPVSRPRTPS
jgi:aminopeptidase N